MPMSLPDGRWRPLPKWRRATDRRGYSQAGRRRGAIYPRFCASLIALVLSCLSMALARGVWCLYCQRPGLRRQSHARAVGRLCGNLSRHAGSVAAVHSRLGHRRGRAPAGICFGASRFRLNYEAYESEIYRSALEAVPGGQLEAARVLGLGDLQVLALVRGPQVLRLALAPITNGLVALLKDSSLVSVVAKICVSLVIREPSAARKSDQAGPGA